MKEYNEQVVETLDDAGCIIANKNIIIDNLQARIAELEAENERLKVENRDSCVGLNDYYGKQLAASQLSETQLREALQTYIDEHEECQDADDWMAMMCSMEAHHTADEALSQPSDTSALDAYVAEKVKEAGKFDIWKTNPYTKVLETSIKQLTRQRDLAVEWLERCAVHVRPTATIFYEEIIEALSAIKEIEAMAQGEK